LFLRIIPSAEGEGEMLHWKEKKGEEGPHGHFPIRTEGGGGGKPLIYS